MRLSKDKEVRIVCRLMHRAVSRRVDKVGTDQ